MKKLLIAFGIIIFSVYDISAKITNFGGGGGGGGDGSANVDGTVINPSSGTVTGSWTVQKESKLSSVTINSLLAGASAPLQIDRGNTVGPWIQFYGNGNLYGSVKLESQGLTFSTGATDSNITFWGMRIGFGTDAAGAKLHVSSGAG